jgi:hypothetical protein
VELEPTVYGVIQMYNVLENAEINTDDIKENLLKDGGLCPCCEKRITPQSLLASFSNEYGVYYYLVCMKCLNMLNKLDDKLKSNKKIRIEQNLLDNIQIYSAILLKPEPVLESSDERMISVLKNNKAEWVEDDKKFFAEHPERRFRSRMIYFGELEETYIDKPHLKGDASSKGISFALIHNIGYGQTVKTFVNDISAYPFEDENFIAALFIVLIQKIPPEKVMDIYKDIAERKTIFKDVESLKTFY